MECLAAAAKPVDMCVEQDGLGARIMFCVFYERKMGSTVAQGNAGRARKRISALPAGCPAFCGRFITMKLQASACYHCAGSYYFGSSFVDKEQHRCDKRRQAARQLRSPLRRYRPGARRVEHKTDGIDTCADGSVHVLFARQPAYLDARADGGR